MFRQILAISLSCLVLFAASPEERTRKLKERVSSIPDGTVVEVRTLDKQRFIGRIGEIADLSFSVQTVRNEKVETVVVEYENAKSLKISAMKDDQRENEKRTAGRFVVSGLAVLGLIVAIQLAAAAAGH